MSRNPVIPHYFGSKNVNGVYQFIINHIPPHKNYVEGFLGSGTIMMNKKPAPGHNIGIDMDAAVIDKFNCAAADIVKDDYRQKSLGDLLGRQHSRSRLSDLMRPGGQSVLFIQGAFIDKFDDWRRRQSSMAVKDTFIYLDPPYPEHTLTGNHRYKHSMSIPDHIELLDYVSGLPVLIAISTYDNDLYRKKLKSWNKSSVQSITRGGKVKTEIVYFNYDSSGKLHDTTYVGKDFTDRQRIKRKISRNIAKIEKLPVQERQAFLEAIQQKFFNHAN